MTSDLIQSHQLDQLDWVAQAKRLSTEHATKLTQVNGGLRFDQGKLPLHLLPPELLTEVARVLEKGAVKYAPRNWELGMDWSRVYGSLMRHLIAWWGGEDNDPETGLPHVAHIACNAAFLTAYNARGIGTDDRPKSV